MTNSLTRAKTIKRQIVLSKKYLSLVYMIVTLVQAQQSLEDLVSGVEVNDWQDGSYSVLHGDGKCADGLGVGVVSTSKSMVPGARL